jgi:hypothetical protein
MLEEWRPVVGYAGHNQVSSIGRVRSFKKNRVRPLALVTNSRGYVQVNLYRDGRVRNRLVHRLVAEAWFGLIPLGHQVNHKDGDKTNNKVANLEIVTGEENRRHARKLGLVRPKIGEANVSAKLKEEDVRAIRLLRSERVPVFEIAYRYKVSQRAVYSLLRGDTWGHVA